MQQSLHAAEALHQIFVRLRQQTYRADLGVGENYTRLLKQVSRWNLVGSAGYLCGPGEEKDYFNEAGDLVKPLILYWQGDGHFLLNMLREAGLPAMFHGGGTNSIVISVEPMVVTLCGSTRFSSAFSQANRAVTFDGHCVYSIGCDFKSDVALGLAPEVKEQADRLHWWKVWKSSVVFVLNRGDYIGASTAAEIRLARALGKLLWWLEPHICQRRCPCTHGPVPQLVGSEPPTVYLCSPLHLLDAQREKNLEETLAHGMVLTCGEDDVTQQKEADMQRLVRLRRWKVHLADRVIAIHDEKGLDLASRQDVELAYALNKPVDVVVVRTKASR